MTNFGQGFLYPLVLNSRGGVNTDNTQALIRTSIEGIIAWAIGTRFFDAEFGVRIKRFLLEPNDMINSKAINVMLTRAITLYETRIELRKVETSIAGTNLVVKYYYLIRGIEVTDSSLIPITS